MNRRITITLGLALAGVATGCDAWEMTEPPVPCLHSIPGIDTTGLNDGDIADDVEFQVWFKALPAPVDYNGNGFWYDGNGDAVGWSSQEDSEICVIDHHPDDAAG